MPLRLHEIHPVLAHYPVALLPAAIAADVAGRLRRDPSLAEVGRKLVPAAFATAAATGLAGLLAQGAVKADGPARDLLVTHRTLNIVGTLALAGLAFWRGRLGRPSTAYLAAGLACAGLVTYSAYLGGKMVYVHGVGVEAAGGIAEGRSPEVGAGSGATALETTVQAARDSAADLMAGELAPHLTR